MPKLGVRSAVTYALVLAVIAATFLQTPPDSRNVIDQALMLALGFFFAKAAGAGS